MEADNYDAKKTQRIARSHTGEEMGQDTVSLLTPRTPGYRIPRVTQPNQLPRTS